MNWIRKKSLRYHWPWKYTVKVTFHFLHKRKLEMAFQRHWCAKNGKNNEKKSSKHLWPWKCLFRGEILVSSTNVVSFNLISEGQMKYCDIHSQHDLRSTTWTRNFFFAISVCELVHYCCWCTEYETNIITHRRSSSHLQNTWMSKNWFIVSIYKRISTRFFFCRGMNFVLIHFYKFIICCRLLIFIHNLLFSRTFKVCT